MGVVANIAADRFPKQGDWLGRRTRVCFHYDTSRITWGTVVRDDNEDPGVTIIRLDDGRYVLAQECQHSPE
jgi:hypothetical protein